MSTLWVMVVDSDLNPVRSETVRAQSVQQREIKLSREQDRWIGQGEPGERILIFVSADGFESETHTVSLRDEINQVVIGLRRPGQLSYSQGNDRLSFSPRDNAFLLTVRGQNAQRIFERVAKKHQMEWKPVSPHSAMSDDDLFLRVEGNAEKSQALTKELAKNNLQIQTSRVIEHGNRPAFGLTDELIIRFQDDVTRAEAERLAAGVGLTILRELRHAGNAFVLQRKEGPSYDLLRTADVLSQSGRVVYVEPNLTFAIEPDAYTPNDPLFDQVPHLQLVNADDAWEQLGNVNVNLRGGSPDITIAVIDLNGIDPTHPDLTANLTDGTSKLVSSMNFTASPIAAQTFASLGGDHGTQCAASATAAFDDNRGIPGVAPNCHLIGARIGGSSNTVLMADIYLWVAGFLNGSTAAGFPTSPPARAADVISSSWGSTGLALSNTIRDCFDFLTTYGRGGKGCIVCFSLGNSGYGDYTNPTGGRFRAWPTYEKTLGVGSSINVNPTNPVNGSVHADPNGATNNIATAVDTRTLFSPFGATAIRKPDLVSPSHTAYNPTLVDPILSAVQVGTGNVDGCPGPAVCNDYAATFGGTSHSTPTVAGAAALVLSARSNLNWVQVREIFRETCVRIDAGQANAIGQWQDLNGDGQIDYSRWYGAGRLDVDAAVAMAIDAALPLADVYVRENLADVGNVPSSGSWWASPDIWVRQNASTSIPTLAWSDAPPHQNARRGQDNAVFCRVRNRGAAAAPSVYVRAMLTHFAGLEFTYPADFQPSTNVGAPVPNPLVPGTYLIGEARIDNLAPSTDQIVKFTWQQALIPPETVVISGASVKWHPCLLVEASPHDGPDPVGGLSVPVQGNNNIAQRNIQIVEANDFSDLFVGMIMGTRDSVGIATLILDTSLLQNAASIRVHIADERAMKQFTAGARRAAEEQMIPVGNREEAVKCAVIIEERTRLRIPCSPCDTVIEAAPGTKIFTGACSTSKPARVNFVKHQDLDTVEFIGLRGQIEIPVRLSPRQYVPLLVAVTGPAAGDLYITQRRGDGERSAGYGIRTG
jgi:hypothetical protein